jgi:hypothetical protein
MKVKSFSMFLATAAVVIMGLLVSPLQASQYLGEVTWTFTDNSDINKTLTVKAGLSKVGGSYYEVQGQAATPNGTIIFSGGGALVNGTLMLSATSTMVETNNGGTYHNATTLQISVDPATYNGSMWMVTTWYLNPPVSPNTVGFGNSYDTGTLTKTSGPLNPAAAPQLPLLLE